MAEETVRIFLALEPPAGARAAIGRWRDSAAGGRQELRPVADEALHATLVFLGRRQREVVGRVWEVAASSLAGLEAPTLTPRGIELVPPRRPRVLAVELEDRDGRAAAVYEALAGALQGAGLHEPERRPFWPHITFARVRARGELRGFSAPRPPADPFTARTVTLYRSDLRPSGARYVALERLELEG